MTAPDVFISYAREDAEMARKFADALQAMGLDVWWDEALRSGEVFDEAIEEALRAAKAVIVLWSPASVQSRWVRAEATLADRKGTLVPVTIAACERPIIFEMIQTADLSEWNGDPADPAWRDFAAHVDQSSGRSQSPSQVPGVSVSRPVPSKPSIAVLPFINLSGDPEQEYFADGVVDDVISALTRFNQLFVIARSSSFIYKGRTIDYRTVANELGVRFVLEGSIRRAGDRLRISGHLVDTQSGEHLWADRFEGAMEDVFDLQDRITEAVVCSIVPTIRQNELERIRRKHPESLDAYDLYLQALPHLWVFDPVGAVPLLEAALAIDPEYPQALAHAAWAYEQRRWYENLEGAAEDARRCMDLVKRCLATQPKDADTVALCAFMTVIVGGDLQSAREIRDRAQLLNVNSAWANFFCSMVDNYTGYSDDAIMLAERAIRHNPLDPGLGVFLHGLAMAMMSQERWEEALLVWERSYVMRADWVVVMAQGVMLYVNLGRLDDARQLVGKIQQRTPDVTGRDLVELFFKATALDRQRWLDAFVAAGLPE